jgi:NTE family protein
MASMRHRASASIIRLALIVALLLPSGAAFPASGQEAARAGASAYSFYESEGNLLETVKPIKVGEAGFIARARTLAGDGEPFGLVLSGGSARAFAHIGVLRALEEAGVHPDFIVADSMGAVIALLYGAGVSPDDLLRLFEAVPAPSLFDVQLPLSGGFVDAARLVGLVRALVGDLDAADLVVPVLVLCEDLVSRREVRLAQGDLATVMAASIALPAVFPPVRMGDMLLIDGGVVVLVPVDIASEYSGKVAVATALYDRRLDFSSAFVNLNRSIDIPKTRSSVAALLRHRPPMIRCDVEKLSYMEYTRPAKVAERGYASARAVMPDILALSPPRALPAALLARRSLYHDRITSVIAARGRGAAFPVPPSARLTLASRLLDEVEEGQASLAGLRYAGLAGRFRVAGFEVGLAGLYGLSGDSDRAWGTRLDAGLGGGRLSESGLAWCIGATAWVFGSAGGEEGSLSARGFLLSGEAGLAASAGRGLVLPRLGMTVTGDLDTGGLAAAGPLAWEFSGGASLRSAPGGEVSGELGLVYLADSQANSGLACSARGSLAVTGAFAFRLRVEGRGAVEGPGWDGRADAAFRGLALGQQAPFRASAGLDVLWLAAALEFDLGELIAFREPELGLYADFDAAGEPAQGGAPPETRIVVGAAASVDLSIVGLSAFGLSAFCGCGLDGSGWSMGLRSGRFRH